MDELRTPALDEMADPPEPGSDPEDDDDFAHLALWAQTWTDMDWRRPRRYPPRPRAECGLARCQLERIARTGMMPLWPPWRSWSPSTAPQTTRGTGSG